MEYSIMKTAATSIELSEAHWSQSSIVLCEDRSLKVLTLKAKTYKCSRRENEVTFKKMKNFEDK